MNLMGRCFAKYLISFIFLAFSASLMSAVREELIEVLKNRSFDTGSIKDFDASVDYKGKTYKVDPDTGEFYEELAPGLKKVLVLKWKGNRGRIYDGDKLVLELKPKELSPTEMIKFNGMALIQRLLGIYHTKSVNPECYIAYAEERLPGPDALDRILALEREENPRPLVFKTDEDWQEFQDDIRELFKSFKSPKAYVVLLGSSTTFFSWNPAKGDSLALFEGPPKCFEDAKDETSERVKSFDSQDALSDIDINLLIPEVSDLCEQAYDNSAELGNEGTRRVYIENTVDKCLAVSPDEIVRMMAKDDPEKSSWPLHGQAFSEFLEKWTPRLDNREINFSVRIRPDQLKAPIKKSMAREDFEEQIARERFVIPLSQ